MRQRLCCAPKLAALEMTALLAAGRPKITNAVPGILGSLECQIGIGVMLESPGLGLLPPVGGDPFSLVGVVGGWVG